MNKYTDVANFEFVNDINNVELQPNTFYYVPIGGSLFRQYVTDKNGNLRNQEGGTPIVAWEDVQNKPSLFPPSAHTHEINEVNGLEEALVAARETNFFNVTNQTGVTILKGTALGFAGTLGNSGKILVKPYLADGSEPSKYFVGVNAEDIDDGEDGSAYVFGPIRGLNTNAFEEGDILFASSTVAGGFTITKPELPNWAISVAVVVTKSATVGELLVRPTLLNVDSEDVFGLAGQLQATLKTTSTVSFENDSIHGSPSLPITGDVTLSSTDAKVGKTALIYHRQSTAPAINLSGYTVGAQILGEYIAETPSVLNVILITHTSSGVVEISYRNDVDGGSGFTPTPFTGNANKVAIVNSVEDNFDYSSLRYVNGKLVVNALSGEDAQLFVKTDDALNTSKAQHIVNDTNQSIWELTNAGYLTHNIRRSALGSSADVQSAINVFNNSGILTSVFEIVNSSAIAPGVRIPKLLVGTIHTTNGILTGGTTNAGLSIYGANPTGSLRGVGTFTQIGDRTVANTNNIAYTVIKRYPNATNYASNKFFIGWQSETNVTNGVDYGPNTSIITDVGFRAVSQFADDGVTPGGLQWRHWGYDWAIPQKAAGVVTNEFTDIIAFKITDGGLSNQVTNFTVFENLFENGQFVNRLKSYVDHNAADADATLRQYAFYKLNNDRTVYTKP
jgi:hypothetical protein